MSNTNGAFSKKLRSLMQKCRYACKCMSPGAPRHSRRHWQQINDLSRREASFSMDYAMQKAVYEEYRLAASKYRQSFPSETINDCYYTLPLLEKTILMVGLGKNVRGNMQYILNELNGSPDFEGFEVYVRTSAETDALVQGFIAQNHWSRTQTVPDEKEYAALMESARYLLTEVFFPESWVKKPGQIYINIWHGTPLKKLGLAKNSPNTHRNGTTQKNFIDADYLLYPNAYTKEKMLDSYRVSQLMKGQLLMLGYPRTGGLLAASRSDLTGVRSRLAPGGERIYAFMPTFRDYLDVNDVVSQATELLDFLDGSMAVDQLLYVNLHHKVNDSIDYSCYSRIRKFPPDIDSYQLLAASDALISDYSSVFFDYLVLRRQIILYIPDYEVYLRERGMYMDLLELPFDMARSGREVLDALNRGKQYDDSQVFRDFSPFDSVDNAHSLCQLILGCEDGLRLAPVPTDSRPRILLYSDAMQHGEATSLLHDYTRTCSRKTFDLYLGCDMELTDHHIESAYPMLFETPVIGSESGAHLSSIGKTVKKLYLENRFTFEEMIGCLCYDYGLMLRRMYGQADFDLMVIYDTENPERILSHTVTSVPKILVLQHHMLEKSQSDRFLRDSIRYAAKYAVSIVTLSDEDRTAAEALLGDSWKEQVRTVSTGSGLDEIIAGHFAEKHRNI